MSTPAHPVIRTLRAAGSAIVAAAVLAGIPYVLARYGGWPLPGAVPGQNEISRTLTSELTDELLLDALTVVLWLLWAPLAVGLLIEVAAQLSGKTAPRLPGLRPFQTLAATLIGTAALALVSVPRVAPPTGPPASAALSATAEPAAPEPVSSVTTTSPAPSAQPSGTTSVPRQDLSGGKLWRTGQTYIVKPGDTLWDIARDRYGAGGHFRKIFHASKAIRQPPGVPRLTDPGLIYPREKLIIPRARTAPAPPPKPPRPPPPAATEPPATSLRPTPTAATSHAPAEDVQRQPSTEIELPSGAVVGLSFAAGIGTALAASRLHRRRLRRSTGQPSRVRQTEPTPPPSVRALRRADLARTETGQPDNAEAPGPQDLPQLFPVASNGQIVIGARDGEEITLPIAGLSLGLTGDGAPAAARALLLGILTHAGHLDAEVTLPRETAAALLNASSDELAGIDEYIPACQLADGHDAALARMEAELIHRQRLLDRHDVSTISAVREIDPAEPVPRTILLATPAGDSGHRLAAVFGSAQACEFGCILLGDCPHGPTLNVAADGHVTSVSGGDAGRWAGIRLFHLTADDAREMLHVVRTAQGAPQPDAGQTPAAAPEPPPPQEPAQSCTVLLQVFGTPVIVVNGTEITTGIRAKGWELLTYLALHPKGESRDLILEELCPRTDHQRATATFHAALHTIRTRLREATKMPDADFVIAADRYRIDPDVIDVDLWQFQRALEEALRTTDGGKRHARLQHATSLYRGDLAEDETYDWIEPDREGLRRQAVDTFTHLATLRQEHDAEKALALLQRALEIDPYTEQTWQQLFQQLGHLNRPDDIRRSFHQLQARLEELSTDPTDETKTLVGRLLRNPAPSSASSLQVKAEMSGRTAKPRMSDTRTVDHRAESKSSHHDDTQ